MYCTYTAVPGSGVLLRSIDCIHAVVRAVLPCIHKKIAIFQGASMAAWETSDTYIIICFPQIVLLNDRTCR